MGSLFSGVATTGQQVVEFIWFPLLIWTLLTLIILGVLRFFNRIHSQYHYHMRLALLMALPFGLFTIFAIEMVSKIFFPESPAEEIFKVFSLVSPLEINMATGSTEQALFSTANLLYAGSFFTLLSGCLILILRYSRQWAHLLAIKKRFTFRPIRFVESIEQRNLWLAASTGKPVKVGFSKEEIIPVTFGLNEPVVLLPESLKKNPRKLNLALRHELIHINQHDFFAHLLTTYIKTLFWFHPFVHLLARQMIDFREMRCDSLVLADRSVSKKEYASLLLELLPMPNLDRQLSVNMAQESSNIKQRIELMVKHDTRKTIPNGLSYVMLGALLACTVIVMAGTDMQTGTLFDEGPDLDLTPSVGAILDIGDILDSEILSPPPPPSRSDDSPDEDFFVVVEEMPELIGGLAEIQRNIRYPGTARRAGIEGRVTVQFVVNEQGDVEDPVVVRGIGGGCDEEAIRAISQAKFRPGLQRGRPVRVQYSLPIFFRLQS